MLYAAIGILTGIAAGLLLPLGIPAAWSAIVAAGLFAVFSSVAGGIRADLEGAFSPVEFLTGLFANVVLGAAMAFLGDRLGVPGLSVAAIYFGFRIFTNLNGIRRLLIGKFSPEKWKT